MAHWDGWTPEQAVTLFCQAAVQLDLIDREDLDYSVNLVLAQLDLDAPQEAASLTPILEIADHLVDIAVARGLCEDSPEARERFSARLFGLVTPGPRAVRECFLHHEQQDGPQAATDWFYRLCRANDYIRTRRIAENIRYHADTPAGELEITINLSKPEKDPKDIAAQRLARSVSYPKCMLCRENPGYAGRPGYPARQNHRIIPIPLAGETWYFQYSPYLYYYEHCIVLNAQHVPMKMTGQSFERMFDFVDRFPHYFIGSNADLPIVGGSILTHDHFQGGRYTFPMERAERWFTFDTGVAGITGEALRWPMTCLRLRGEDRHALSALMQRVLAAWRVHSDEQLGILARTKAGHNAVTPVVRKEKDAYVAYLLLRNNRTTQEHPLGLFHPHQERHHIKKENIGLIEAMGLFILPGRLKKELTQVQDFLLRGTALPPDTPHRIWVGELMGRLPKGLDDKSAEAFLRDEVARVCHDVLVDTGVYQQDEQGMAGLKRFLNDVGLKPQKESK